MAEVITAVEVILAAAAADTVVAVAGTIDSARRV
jgi:hypothetical protein